MRMTKPQGIRYKLAMGIGLTMLIVLGIGYIGAVQYIRTQLWERETQAAQTLNAIVENSINNAMMVGHKDVIQQTLNEFGQSVGGQIDSIAVYDDQSILTSFATGFPGGRTIQLDSMQVDQNGSTCWGCHQLPADERPQMMVVNLEGKDVLRSVVPLYNETRCQSCHGTGLAVLGDSIVDLRLDNFQQSFITISLTLGLGILLAAIIVVLVFFRLLNRTILNPVENLVETTQLVTRGEFGKKVDISTQDEIGQLGLAFNSMSVQIQELIEDLEHRVASRTYDYERRALQLQAATEVGHAAATIRDQNELLSQVTELISERFDFYHVGVFLLDDKKEYAVLRASNSEGGKRMLSRDHKLRIGHEGIVGHVTSHRRPRIALDVGSDAVFFDNPDLPETRSEMALPLIVGDEILGALDVQSKRESAFANDDISALQALADQVAIAIENALLFTELQVSLDVTRRAYGDRSRTSWDEYLKSEGELGFLSTVSQDILVDSKDFTPEMVEASQRGEIIQADDYCIVVPIILRDQVLGVVRLQKSADAQPWNEEEINLMDTIIDQLEAALESARLYKDTQQRAQRERMVTEITTKIRASTDPQTMLQTAVSELREALRAQRAQMVIQSDSKN
ncbi:MAG: GAF domain-containing protein [Anaerolineales bacterium]|nr:GAF domain-containing protein [Chloroflexota bacterium]MBL6979738.1 GAF domain-containing protein [Anaerolineales bacterium]